MSAPKGASTASRATPVWQLPAGVASRGHSPRDRLLAGMASAINERGYEAATVDDVVRNAGVSKRTFYEHFSDRNDCLLALYESAQEWLVGRVTDASAPPGDWEQRVTRGIAAYLESVAAAPELGRTYLVEIPRTGPRGLVLRRRAHEMWALLIESCVADHQREHPDAKLPELRPELLIAITGGLDELVLDAIERGHIKQVPELLPVAVEFVRAIITRSA